MALRKLEYLIAVSIAVFAFIVYLATLCPTVSFIDSGELTTDIYTLGIAHPTGYPFFTLVGYAFCHLPLGLRVVYQANLMAAIFCSAGLFFFFRFLVFFLTAFVQPKPKGNVSKNPPDARHTIVQIFLPAGVGTLILAFSETYWSQALSIEVYSLHVFFLALLLLLFAKAIASENFPNEKNGVSSKNSAYWMLFAVVLGLSFANHMTTILLAPACLVAFFYSFGLGSRKGWGRILRLIVPFAIGLSVYFYLPVRAAMKPLMNWGNPVDLEHFMWHFTGKVYRVWIFSSFESAGKQFGYFLDTLPGEFAYVPLLLALIGVWNLFKNNKPALVFTLLLFLGCVGYSINYDIHDIDSYFLLAYITIALWCAVGLSRLIQSGKIYQNIIIIGSILMCGCIVLINYKKVDESKSFLVEEYAKDVFNSIEPNGIVISYQWDYFVSAAYYFQLVEHIRPDIVVIDKELLRRTWYLQQLQQRYPSLLQQSQKELDAYTAELYKFEHSIPYNASVIESRYASFIRSLVEKNLRTRPVYVMSEIEQQYIQGYQRVPSGVTFRLYSDNNIHETPSPNFHFNIPSVTDKYVDGILSMYAQGYLNNAIYADMMGKKDSAMVYIEKALEIRPNYSEARVLKERLMAK